MADSAVWQHAIYTGQVKLALFENRDLAITHVHDARVVMAELLNIYGISALRDQGQPVGFYYLDRTLQDGTVVRAEVNDNHHILKITSPFPEVPPEPVAPVELPEPEPAEEPLFFKKDVGVFTHVFKSPGSVMQVGILFVPVDPPRVPLPHPKQCKNVDVFLYVKAYSFHPVLVSSGFDFDDFRANAPGGGWQLSNAADSLAGVPAINDPENKSIFEVEGLVELPIAIPIPFFGTYIASTLIADPSDSGYVDILRGNSRVLEAEPIGTQCEYPGNAHDRALGYVGNIANAAPFSIWSFGGTFELPWDGAGSNLQYGDNLFFLRQEVTVTWLEDADGNVVEGSTNRTSEYKYL